MTGEGSRNMEVFPHGTLDPTGVDLGRFDQLRNIHPSMISIHGGRPNPCGLLQTPVWRVIKGMGDRACNAMRTLSGRPIFPPFLKGDEVTCKRLKLREMRAEKPREDEIKSRRIRERSSLCIEKTAEGPQEQDGKYRCRC